MIRVCQLAAKFQYHTFLHHSQTPQAVQQAILLFQYHTFLHHSQTDVNVSTVAERFQYHTFLHHSQTCNWNHPTWQSFSTIRFYIILKHRL